MWGDVRGKLGGKWQDMGAGSVADLKNGETNLSAERACVDHDQGDPERGDGYEAIQ